MSEKQNDSCSWVIKGEMTIYQANQLKDIVISKLESTVSSLNLDLSEVTGIDTAGVQMLISAKQSARDKNKAIHFIKMSEPVIETLKLLNILDYLNALEAIPSDI